MGALLQRIGGNQQSGITAGFAPLLACQRVRGEGIQSAQVSLFALYPFEMRPLLLAILQQRTAIQSHRSLQRSNILATHGCVEGHHVTKTLLQIQKQRAESGLKAHALLAQIGLEVAQLAPEIVKRLALHTVRPENAGEPLPFDLPAILEYKQREQPFLTSGAQRDEVSVASDLQASQEAHRETSEVGFVNAPCHKALLRSCRWVANREKEGSNAHFTRLTRFSPRS